jgi:hypothetical protein
MIWIEVRAWTLALYMLGLWPEGLALASICERRKMATQLGRRGAYEFAGSGVRYGYQRVRGHYVTGKWGAFRGILTYRKAAPFSYV